MPAARSRVVVLVALFVTLIPTTIGALLSAIGIAGMDRLVRFNVLAMSGRAVEAAGDVDTLLLDKTGTITLGNRQATEFMPVSGVAERDARAMRPSSPAWRTRRRRAARSSCWPRRSTACAASRWPSCNAQFIPFTAQTRMSGIDIDGASIRKGAVDAIVEHARRTARADRRPTSSSRSPSNIAKQGGTPLAVSRDGQRAGRRPSQGHRQGRHPRALRRAARAWASAP